MSNQRQAMAAYQAAIRTTPPLKAVVMLYDRILFHIAGAAAAVQRKDYETQFNEIMRAARIVDGLNRCLDMENGAKVAASLREMYEAVAKALLSSVGRATGAHALEKIAAGVRKTRDAWAEISGMRASTPASADAAALRRPEPQKRVETGAAASHQIAGDQIAGDQIICGQILGVQAALARAAFGS